METSCKAFLEHASKDTDRVPARGRAACPRRVQEQRRRARHALLGLGTGDSVDSPRNTANGRASGRLTRRNAVYFLGNICEKRKPERSQPRVPRGKGYGDRAAAWGLSYAREFADYAIGKRLQRYTPVLGEDSHSVYCLNHNSRSVSVTNGHVLGIAFAAHVSYSFYQDAAKDNVEFGYRRAFS